MYINSFSAIKNDYIALVFLLNHLANSFIPSDVSLLMSRIDTSLVHGMVMLHNHTCTQSVLVR